MMFDDPLAGGAGLLNTSMKSEGGQSGRGEDGEDRDTTVVGEKAASDGEGQLALDVDSIKIMAETVHMSGIPEEAAREIAEEVKSFRVSCHVHERKQKTFYSYFLRKLSHPN